MVSKAQQKALLENAIEKGIKDLGGVNKLKSMKKKAIMEALSYSESYEEEFLDEVQEYIGEALERDPKFQNLTQKEQQQLFKNFFPEGSWGSKLINKTIDSYKVSI